EIETKHLWGRPCWTDGYRLSRSLEAFTHFLVRWAICVVSLHGIVSDGLFDLVTRFIWRRYLVRQTVVPHQCQSVSGFHRFPHETSGPPLRRRLARKGIGY